MSNKILSPFEYGMNARLANFPFAYPVLHHPSTILIVKSDQIKQPGLCVKFAFENVGINSIEFGMKIGVSIPMVELCGDFSQVKNIADFCEYMKALKGDTNVSEVF